jgi:hypothetical protein
VHLRAEAPESELRALLSAIPGVHDLAVAEGRFRFHARDESVVREVSRTVTQRSWILLELSRESLSLEEIFLRLVQLGAPQESAK